MSTPLLALAPLGYLELDPPELVEVAGAAGFQQVTFRVHPALPGGAHYPLPPGSSDARRTLERMDAVGVAVLQVELIPLDRLTDLATTRRVIESGAALGAARVVVSGDDPSEHAVAEKLAAVAAIAAEHGMWVDLEFMPFRPVATLAQALATVESAGCDNVAVMIDALHLARSGGTIAEVAAADSRRLAVLQLCDARLAAPPADRLAQEAREGRLLPGRGELPLSALIAAMPAHTLTAAEVPLTGGESAAPAAQRAQQLFAATAALVRR